MLVYQRVCVRANSHGSFTGKDGESAFFEWNGASWFTHLRLMNTRLPWIDSRVYRNLAPSGIAFQDVLSGLPWLLLAFCNVVGRLQAKGSSGCLQGAVFEVSKKQKGKVGLMKINDIQCTHVAISHFWCHILPYSVQKKENVRKTIVFAMWNYWGGAASSFTPDSCDILGHRRSHQQGACWPQRCCNHSHHPSRGHKWLSDV
jgi:hypothetical protein